MYVYNPAHKLTWHLLTIKETCTTLFHHYHYGGDEDKPLV